MPIYSRWAKYYDLLYSFKDYQADATRVMSIIERFHPRARTLLDVACGTGRHLSLLKDRFEVEGLDANAELLELARQRVPDIRFHQGRMEDFDLLRRYDVITCLFSAIGFVRTSEALRATIASMKRHLAPGGLVIIEPWFSRESLWTGTITAHFIDKENLKIAWMYTTAIEQGLCVLANQYLVGTPEGIEGFQEDHVLGLFSTADFEVAFESVGLQLHRISDPGWKRGVYVASDSPRQ